MSSDNLSQQTEHEFWTEIGRPVAYTMTVVIGWAILGTTLHNAGVIQPGTLEFEAMIWSGVALAAVVFIYYGIRGDPF